MKRTDNSPSIPGPNGVIVPGNLRVNEMTLQEHQDYLAGLNYRRLSFDEAAKIHGATEALVYFGVTSLEARFLEE